MPRPGIAHRYHRFLDRYALFGKDTRPVFANTGWLLLEHGTRIVFGLLVGAWVARHLGPAQYGELAYAVAFVALFQTLGKLGLDQVLVRDLARAPRDAATLLGTAWWLRFGASWVLWGMAIGIVAALRPDDRDALLLVAIASSTVVFQSADVIDLWFRSRSTSRFTVLAKTTALVLASAVRVTLILVDAPLFAFALAIALEAALTAAGLACLFHRQPARPGWAWHAARVRGLLRESWHYLVAGIAVVAYMRIDQVMLREMDGERSLGIYSAAVTVSTLWYVLPTAICLSAGPMFARARQSSLAEYHQALDRLFRVAWWYSLPLSLVVALLASPIVALLYGDAYADSAAVLAVHVFSNIPAALGTAQSLWIANEGRGIISLQQSLVGFVCNVCLNFLLIPKYGPMGAAFATLISFVFAANLSNIVLAPSIFRRQLVVFRRRP